MKFLFGVLLGVGLFMLQLPAISSPKTPQLFLMGWDGQFLGYIGDGQSLCLEQDPNCIWSDTGPYGSPLSPTSIWNPNSTYQQATCGHLPDYDPVAIMVQWDNSTYDFYDYISEFASSVEGHILWHTLCNN
jgi:hypothetical protein